MTKGEEFEKAWRLGFQGDFSMVDKIYHPNHKSIDHRFGIKVNIDSDKAMISTVAGNVVFGPFRTLYENDEILVIHRYNIFLEADLTKAYQGSQLLGSLFPTRAVAVLAR